MHPAVEFAYSKGVRSGDSLVLTFVMVPLFHLLINQMAHMRKIDPALPVRLGVVCLDQESAVRLRLLSAPSCFEPVQWTSSNESVRTSVWILRVHLIRTLANHGIGVLLTDLDAVWVADPRPWMMDPWSGNTRPAVAGGSETSTPSGATESLSVDVVAAWGGVLKRKHRQQGMCAQLCMGLISFAPASRAARLLLAEMERFMSYVQPDDQIAMNHALFNSANLRWHDRSPYECNATTPQTSVSALGSGVINGSKIRVLALPRSRFRRGCFEDGLAQNDLLSHIINVHPYRQCADLKPARGSAASSSAMRSRLLVNFSGVRPRPLWILRPNWDDFLRQRLSVTPTDEITEKLTGQQKKAAHMNSLRFAQHRSFVNFLEHMSL